MAHPHPAEFCKDPLPQEILALKERVEQLPPSARDKLLPLCEWVTHYCRLQNRLIRVSQEAVEQLQLDVKYLHFDIEATRRERDALLPDFDSIEDEEDF